MKLPNLPKQNKSKEADFGVYLKNWVEENPFNYSCSMELKQTESNSISFSCLDAKQIAYALKVKSNKGCWIRVIGLDGQPDYVWMFKEIAYVVIRYPTMFCFIDISVFIQERDTSKRKSLTSTRAKEIAHTVIPLH